MDFSCSSKGTLRKIFAAGLGSHQQFLISKLRGRGLSATNVSFKWSMMRSTTA
jgi:hypothetical protein